jgi:hypothetical protein
MSRPPDTDGCALPGNRFVQFRDRNIEPVTKFLFEAANHLAPVLERVRLLDVQFKRERNNSHSYPSAVCAAVINSSAFIAARELHWTNPLRQDASPRNCRQGEHSGW